MVRRLMQRARSIATAHPTPNYSENSQPTGVVQEPENYMQQWFEITYLKNGLQSWRHELGKMISHCDDLIQARFYTSKRPSESSESTPVNTAFSTDAFVDGFSANDTSEDEIRDLTISARRIRQRLLEIQAEYDDKIRECGMIIDGMVLAAQLVSRDNLNRIATSSLTIFGRRSGITSVKVIRRQTWTYQIPTSR